MTTIGWTLKTVAAKLGVSTATISNAFNRPDQLSASLRDKILAACAELGYQGPNKAAQSLRRGSSGIVAVILSDSLEYMVSDPVASQFLRGVGQALEQQQLNLLLFSGSSASLEPIADFVDGFICYGAPRNPALSVQLSQTRKRVLTVDFNLPGKASLNIDNFGAAMAISRQVIRADSQVAVLGLRLIDSDTVTPIGVTPLLDNDSSIAHRRLDGYQAAMQQLGLSLDPMRVWHLPESNQAMAAIAAKAALSATPRPTVLLCMSDLIALTAMREALQLGLRIPDDLQVVGFDGIDEGTRYHPTLSSVWQFSDEKGRQAVAAFLRADSQSDVRRELGAEEASVTTPESVMLPFEIRWGESTAARPN
jgi:DNA-binding LacI/PurR family transcriptional regulator